MFKESIESDNSLEQKRENSKSKRFEKFWSRTSGDKLRIDPRKFILLLITLGFAKYIRGKSMDLIKVTNNIVEVVTIPEIKDHVINFLRSIDKSDLYGEKLEDLESVVISSGNKVFASNNLEFLPTKNPHFLDDQRDISYFPFLNGLVSVTESEIKVDSYSDYGSYFWKDQIIHRNFNYTKEKSDFQSFCEKAMDNDEERINSLFSVIGYMLHRFKDPANPKSPIFIDSRISNGSSGRCGKSLIANSLGKLRKVISIYGRLFNASKNFAFQRITEDTNIVLIDDCRKNFPMENLFSIQSEGWVVEVKNKPEIFIPYEKSPKPILTSNYILGAYDESTIGRQINIEFGNYFNSQHTPKDEFGKTFFSDWDDEEWNLFDSFMLGCVQLFLRNGLIACNSENMQYKRLVESTSPEFVEFINTPENFQFNTEYDKKTLHSCFKRIYPDFERRSQGEFTSWLKFLQTYDSKKYHYEERKSGERRFITLHLIEGEKN